MNSEPHTTEEPTTIAGYALAIARALEYKGVDSQRVFRAAGLNDTYVNDPMQRLPVGAMSRLFQLCAEVTRDPYFGLTVARFAQASTLHALGYALLASSSLRDFCKRLERYFRLVSQTARVELVEQGGEAILCSYPLVPTRPETQDAWAGIVLRIMRSLYVNSLDPLRVELAHAVPDGGDEPYVEFFNAPVVFDRPHVALVLPASVLDQPLNSACPELAQQNDNIAATYIARLDRKDIVASVRAKLIELLPTGACSLAHVAKALAMSEGLVRLKLGQRNTCFQDLLDEIRMELAGSYLSQQDLPVTEIAFLLGYSDSSNFTRAFRRWSGLSPSAYRAGKQAKGA